MFPSYIGAPAFALLLLLSCFGNSYATPPSIVVSIKPLHSIVTQITQGISQPELLLEQEVSAHHFQLKPSQKKKLIHADIFIYSSEQIESFATKQKQSVTDTRFIALEEIKGLDILPARNLHQHLQHGDHADQAPASSHSVDGHIWLSIANVIKISGYLTRQLIEADPEHQTRYTQNLLNFTARLQQLKTDNKQLLSKYSSASFLVYHDAYQYFEIENNLQGAHFITTSPDVSPGIKRVKYLQQLIRFEDIHCVFYEPPNIPPLMKTITEKQSVKLVSLDPLGLELPAGADHYINLMSQTARSVYDCLSTTTGQ